MNPTSFSALLTLRACAPGKSSIGYARRPNPRALRPARVVRTPRTKDPNRWRINDEFPNDE